MAHRKLSVTLAGVLCLGAIVCVVAPDGVYAQAPPASTTTARQLGTVKSVSAEGLTLATDAGQTVSVSVSPETKVLKLAAGSTDLKTAQPGQLSDIAVGDRVLATGKAGDTTGSVTAARLILMKSSDIAQKNAADQAQWRTNGTGGIVSSVDPSTGTIVLTAGTNKVTVTTTGNTVFKRFTGDSVKYQDAKLGTMADIHPGDQLQARGQKSADGLTVKADEVLSGSFKNLSGVIITADANAGTITLKDLATKKAMTVKVTSNTNIRKMPPQMAQMFAARSAGGGQGGGRSADQAGARAGQQTGGPGRAAWAGENANGGASANASAGEPANGSRRPFGPGGMRRGNGDLSQMLNRLPTDTLADLKKGDAVMVVATEPTPGATTVSAITLLTGVEPILTANPNGGIDLGGWNMGEAPAAGAE